MYFLSYMGAYMIFLLCDRAVSHLGESAVRTSTGLDQGEGGRGGGLCAHGQAVLNRREARLRGRDRRTERSPVERCGLAGRPAAAAGCVAHVVAVVRAGSALD